MDTVHVYLKYGMLPNVHLYCIIPCLLQSQSFILFLKQYQKYQPYLPPNSFFSLTI
ncbi:hypothetical protein BDZ91DRAFT_722549 [Kalaharituber pfeilii]|nr:hypothetical protein BDZ91DRAFT_722549 [Kalaharituber pfeilii]